MAEPSAQVDAGKSTRAWEHDATRREILAAARRLAAREGAETITLSRVAAEAGFAPPAVYAYFVSKDDLHLAVVADDLGKLAQAMRGDAPVELDAEPEQADNPEPAAVIALHPEAAGEDAHAAAEDAADDAAPSEAVPAGNETALTEPEADDIVDTAPVPDLDDNTPGRQDEAPNPDAAQLQAQMGMLDEDGDSDGEAAKGSIVSLIEIEQAIGVVLASPNDFVEPVPPGEEVPDAFPEEAVLPGDASGPETEEDEPHDSQAGDAAPGPSEGQFVERRANPDRPRLRSRLRRSRKAEPDNPQMAMPLDAVAEQASGDVSDPAAAIAQLQEAIARLESRPVDTWLERRLRVFERTLADIEVRMEKAERDSATALSTVSDSFKALEERFSETLNGASRGLTDNEQRHRAAISDLRMYVKDLSGRLGAVETSLSRALDDSGNGVEFRPAAYDHYEAQDEEPDDRAAASGRPKAGDRGDGEHFLATARRAANSAAAETGRSPVRNPLSLLKMSSVDAKGLSISRRGLQIVAGVLTLIVALMAAGIALRGKSDGAADPATPAIVRPVAQAPATASPDARVAALAKAGNARAELVVGLKLLNGDGVETDVPSAAHWLKASAAQNEPVAAYWLGTLYERGRGVAKDRAKAMQWYARAAKSGNAKAMYRLGVGHAEGWNGETDYVAAAKWFTKAAKLGVIDAQFNLAVLYERGSGVPQGFTNAFKWYAIAAAQGDSESKARINSLATQMPVHDVATAQAEAAGFQSKQPAPAANLAPSVAAVAATR